MDNIINITELTNNAVSKIITSGFIEKKIEENIEATISSVVRDIFVSYGDFGKSLKDVLSQKMKINFSDLDIPVYNEYILSLIKSVVDKELADAGYQKIADRVKEILGETLKSDYKITEVFDLFMEQTRGWKDQDDTATLIIKKNYSSWWISIDEDSDKREYECKYRFSVGEDKLINSLDIGSRGNSGYLSKPVARITTDAFGEFLLKAKGQGVKIEMDETDVDYFNLNYHEDDD